MAQHSQAGGETFKISKVEAGLDVNRKDGTLKECEWVTCLPDGTELERVIEHYDEKGRRRQRLVTRRKPTPR